MRQLWMIRLAFRYLLLRNNHAAWPPQPAALVCMPFSGNRGSIGDDDSGVPLAAAAHFTEKAPIVLGLQFRGPLRGTNTNTVRAGSDAYGHAFATACRVPIRLPRQSESGSLCRQTDNKTTSKARRITGQRRCIERCAASESTLLQPSYLNQGPSCA